MYYVGIDWADKKHDVVILDDSGAYVVTPTTIPKSHVGFTRLLTMLRNVSHDQQQFKIGIETAHNVLVDFLVESNYQVFSIFPGSMKSFRKRYRASKARDDIFDAYVIADVLRTDKACWRQVDFGSDAVRTLRILVRDHHHLVNEQTALSNTLRSTLKEYYPEYIQFFADVTCPSSLAFLQAYPDFASASQLTEQQVSSFFKELRYYNTKRATQIYRILQQQHISVNPMVVATKQLKALAYAKQLTMWHGIVECYQKQIKTRLYQHPDKNIFLSYPGVGDILAARLLSIFGDNRKLYDSANEIQQLAGTCPVTEKSGNMHNIFYRRACNRFYRDTFHQLAFASLTKSDWAMAYYKQHRAKMNRNAHALRCLANIHLKILFAMWQNKSPYDENIFLAKRMKNQINIDKKLLP